MVFTYVRIACLLCRYNHPTWLLCTLLELLLLYILRSITRRAWEKSSSESSSVRIWREKVVGGLGGSLSAGGSWSGLETLETIRHQPFPSELWPQALTSECYIWARTVFFLSHIDHAGGHWSTLISTLLQSLAWGWVRGGLGLGGQIISNNPHWDFQISLAPNTTNFKLFNDIFQTMLEYSYW